MTKRIVMIFCIFLLSTFYSVALGNEFPDVPASHWAYTYIKELTDKGIINGYTDGTYKPSNNVTRAEFIKLMVSTDDYMNISALSISKVSQQEHWYDPYVFVLNDSEINPYNYTDEMYNKPITRIEIAVLTRCFCNLKKLIVDTEQLSAEDSKAFDEYLIQVATEKGYIKKKKINMQEFDEMYAKLKDEQKNELNELAYKLYLESHPNKQENTQPFTDTANLSLLELNYLNDLRKLNILNGYEDGSFRPKNNVTRAEVSTVISKYLNVVNSK